MAEKNLYIYHAVWVGTNHCHLVIYASSQLSSRSYQVHLVDYSTQTSKDNVEEYWMNLYFDDFSSCFHFPEHVEGT